VLLRGVDVRIHSLPGHGGTDITAGLNNGECCSAQRVERGGIGMGSVEAVIVRADFVDFLLRKRHPAQLDKTPEPLMPMAITERHISFLSFVVLYFLVYKKIIDKYTQTHL